MNRRGLPSIGCSIEAIEEDEVARLSGPKNLLRFISSVTELLRLTNESCPCLVLWANGS